MSDEHVVNPWFRCTPAEGRIHTWAPTAERGVVEHEVASERAGLHALLAGLLAGSGELELDDQLEDQLVDIGFLVPASAVPHPAVYSLAEDVSPTAALLANLPADTTAWRERPAPQLAAETALAARATLARGHARLAELVSPRQAASLRRYFAAMARAGFGVRGNGQRRDATGSVISFFDDPIASHYLGELRGVVSQVLGREVVPTYTYAAYYRQGASLAWHTDRDECEYSLALQLGCETSADGSPYPLLFEVADGQVDELRLPPRDACLFRGRQHRHARPLLAEHEHWLSLLFHYVDAP